jgi:hypothetical protein
MSNDKEENSGCLGFLLPFLRNIKSTLNSDLKFKTYPKSEPLPYRVRDDFLSPAEFSFYKILLTILGSHITIPVNNFMVVKIFLSVERLNVFLSKRNLHLIKKKTLC